MEVKAIFFPIFFNNLWNQMENAIQGRTEMFITL